MIVFFFFLIGIEVQYIAVFRMLGFFVAVPRYKNADQIFKKSLTDDTELHYDSSILAKDHQILRVILPEKSDN